MKISHIMYTSKILTDLCAKNKKCNNKKHFCRYCLQCFTSEKVLTEHKEVCLRINRKQTIKLRSGSIKFKNYLKQLTGSFKICADFECNVKRVKCSDRGKNASQTEKDIKILFLAVLQSCLC